MSDCIVGTSDSAFKCGTGSGQGFRNIVVNNLVVCDTARSGIALQIVDGGTMENVAISNVVMQNVGNALFIRLGDRSRINREHQGTGTLRDVVISNVVAEITGFDADAGLRFEGVHLPQHGGRIYLNDVADDVLTGCTCEIRRATSGGTRVAP